VSGREDMDDQYDGCLDAIAIVRRLASLIKTLKPGGSDPHERAWCAWRVAEPDGAPHRATGR
jgi:hypothetical protein